jgi:hypothetical protein
MLHIEKVCSQASIAQAQAVFIYNFTRLIEWPAEYKTGVFTIGILGTSELYDEMKNYTNGKMVGSQTINTVKYNAIEFIGKCHILFVPFNKTKDLEAIKNKIGNNSTLIISEKKGALDNGAMINFVIIEDRLKFELKMSNATKIGLKIHSNLENMAVAKY